MESHKTILVGQMIFHIFLADNEASACVGKTIRLEKVQTVGNKNCDLVYFPLKYLCNVHSYFWAAIIETD